MKPGDTVFVTKWCLTQGIEKCKVRSLNDGETYANILSRPFGMLRIGRDVFLLHADAVANAQDRVRRKLKSLRKQRLKLEAYAKELRDS